jgi:hypothetical protein
MTASVQHARRRIEVEYTEMPDLKLTFAQIRRLCDLPHALCDEAVASLMATGFLSRTRDGDYVRCGVGQSTVGVR